MTECAAWSTNHVAHDDQGLLTDVMLPTFPPSLWKLQAYPRYPKSAHSSTTASDSVLPGSAEWLSASNRCGTEGMRQIRQEQGEVIGKPGMTHQGAWRWDQARCPSCTSLTLTRWLMAWRRSEAPGARHRCSRPAAVSGGRWDRQAAAA